MGISSNTTLPPPYSSNTSSGPAVAGPAPGIRRSYRFTVITLSVLLLSMAIWRPSPSGHVAEVILRHQAFDSTLLSDHGIMGAREAIADGPSRVNAWFQNGVRLREMANGWAQSSNSPLARQSPQGRRNWADHFVARLSYLVQTDGEGASQIAVRAIDTDPKRGVWALQRLTDQFAADHISMREATQIVERIGGLDLEIQATREEARITQASLQDFVRLQLQEGRKAFTAQAAKAASGAATGPLGGDQRVEIINPQWQQLRGSLEAAQRELAGLAKSRTSDHPELAIRRGQIGELEQKVAQTPMYLPNPTTTAAPPTVASVPAVATSLFDSEAALQEIEFSEEYQGLYAAHSEAEGRLHQLEQARGQLPSRELLLRGTVGVQAPTQTVSTLKGRYRPAHFFGLVLFSVLVGLVFALWPTRILQPSTMYSVQDVADSLGLPVIGAVSCPGGQPVMEPEVGRPTPATWTATRLGELVLVGVVLLMVTLLIGERGFRGELLQDPFAAYTTAVDRVIHWLI